MAQNAYSMAKMDFSFHYALCRYPAEFLNFTEDFYEM